MYKIFVIARRDYLATVRTKSFLIGLLLIPVLMIGGGSVLAVLAAFMVLHGDTADRHIAVIDRTPGGKLFPVLEDAVRVRNENQIYSPIGKRQIRSRFELERIEPSADEADAVQQQRYDLSARVQRGELAGFLDIGPDVIASKAVPSVPEALPMLPAGHSPLGNLNLEKRSHTRTPAEQRAVIRYQSDRLTVNEFPLWVDGIVNRAILRQRWLDAGMPEGRLPALHAVPVLSEGLTRPDAATGTLRDAPLPEQLAGYLVPAALVFLMFLSVMIGTGPAMQNVVEEKLQRIAEVLLGSVRPFELMMGKLLGVTGVSLTISIVYLSAAFIGAAISGLISLLPVPVILWFFPFQVLALMMFGSLSLAIGAAAKDIKGTQPYILPVAMLATLPMFFLTPVLQHPNGTFATSLSFFPFATPMLMTARMAVPPGVPWWQPVAAVIPTIGTMLLCVFVAGRVFRVGILMQGKGASPTDLVRWIVRG